MKRYFTYQDNKKVPVIKGAFSSGPSGGGGFTEEPNSLFSTDILFVLTALGEGPIYRINPNGPQDIEITENSINDLIKIDGDGSENGEVFKTASTTGTITQAPLRKWGQSIVTPQQFSSPVNLKKGNVAGIPEQKVLLQETSARAWDEINLVILVNGLFKQDDRGNVKAHSVTIRTTFFDSTGAIQIANPIDTTINGKTNTPYKRIINFEVPEDFKSDSGYRFTVEKITDESESSKITSQVQVVGWFEVENSPQSYPRTALTGYAIKAINEHAGGVPTLSSLVKGLIVKVPSNYNQPVLEDGQIDWRQVELPESGSFGYTVNGYELQRTNPGLHVDNPDQPDNDPSESGDTFSTGRLTLKAGTYYDFKYTVSMGSGRNHFGIMLKGTDGVNRFFNDNIIIRSGGSWADNKEVWTVSVCSAGKEGKAYGVDFGLTCKYSWAVADGGGGGGGGYGASQLNMPTKGSPQAGQNVTARIVGSPSEDLTLSWAVHRDFNEDQIGTNIAPDVAPVGHFKRNDYTAAVAPANDTPASSFTYANPQIYVGTWDGTFVYSWTQNPVWIIYDILTNTTYGLGIPEDNIDKYKFYQVAQYCDACNSITGRFEGVDGQADGSFRHKPRGQFTTVREALVGIPVGTQVKERRFVYDAIIADQRQAMETLNAIAASFRGTIIHSFGKISLSVDLPDQLPVMVFNETNIKSGTFEISGGRESDLVTGVDVSYIEPTNHYKREVVRVDTIDVNDGSDRSTIENVLALDLAGVTRRSQALRFAQYQIAASRYLRRVVSFTTSTDALNLAPGDIISVSQNITGINFGFGGKVRLDSTVGSGHVLLEHFTVPTLANSTFTANTGPLALRVIKQNSDRIDTYLLSNSTFSLTATDNVSNGFDNANVSIIARYNPVTKSVDSYTAFTANNVPTRGDIWSIGEWENPGNFYTNKAGKLFTVSNIERETQSEEINIVAKEYISNVYEDSDTFIDYTPTAYIDIESGFSAPPPPVFSLTKQTRRRIDGSISHDIRIDNQTDRLGYQSPFSTQYFMSLPVASTPVTNTNQSVLTITVDNAAALANGETQSTLTGKNGFQTFAGDIRLLCNNKSVIDNGDGTSNVRLTLEGLNVIHDENFAKHVLTVNDGSFLGLKGSDFVSVPLREKADINSQKNFIAFATDISTISSNIVSFDLSNDTIDIENAVTGSQITSDHIVDTPFFVTVNQLLDARFFSNNSIYVRGTEKEIVLTGNLNTASGTTASIDLPVRVRKPQFVRLFVDGVQKSSGQFSVNKNTTIKDNVNYSVQSGDNLFRVEIDHYTVPTIEKNDNVQTGPGNVFAVANVSYDPSDPDYNAALTANSIFRIKLENTPQNNLTSVALTNITPNPIGTINNVLANTCTLDYDEDVFPGSFNLGNNFVYDLQVSADYERIYPSEDLVIRDLDEGVVSIRARNINANRRTSPFVTKDILISKLPIRKVTGAVVNESLYREQNSGVAVRTTLIFDAITGQEVTDYEVSYKLDNIDDVGVDDGGGDLLSFNTVKIPAAGIDDDGKIRYTVSGINRGARAESNIITFRITPLNKNVRGVTTTVTKSIIGKSAKPDNVFNFTGGQQSDQITLFWEYERFNEDLKDLDLKEVVIRRLPGTVDINDTNFVAAVPFVSVAAGVNRKSVPIDVFGTFTYLAKTRDTSGNLSDAVTGITLVTSRPARTTVVAAFNEDDPSTNFTLITNDNASEVSYPSFANSNTGGVSIPSQPTSLVDNANGSSSGFSAIAGAGTDLLADGPAEYITQVRDYGVEVTGSINIDIEGSQAIETTWVDTHEHFLANLDAGVSGDSTTEASPAGNVLVDSSFGGIGHLLGFNNTQVTSYRFDSNNKTLMSGGSFGNVFAIHCHGNFTNDTANANVIALIAGTINANAIELGETFFANGVSTGGNTIANLAVAGTSYFLANFDQYGDPGGTSTFAGTLGSLTTQTFIRTASVESGLMFHANGNVNVASFTGSAVNDGFVPYEAGSRTFRQFQIKFIINNAKQDQFDFTIDKFRYTIEKEQTIFEDTVTYDSESKVVNYASQNFKNRPVINIQPIDTQTAQTALVVSGSNSSVTFKLFDVENNALAPTDQSIQVQITATGV